ncbi:hypothetical protein B484DRAFT_183357 [Ochromonadaceae sp. CCMP2298]|nr:hypothetical protein B484DRAFT_183357 [Ochromonadaceae sp. CCMP2298]|eukprot:CAMPEP_0173187546 /NCGR_PEP_ID=MMETSP1141-20130122/10769_1 /TAXON_ID=483371 /ORGANISM="non described non described, Strain CCMP2298" /LENGTH=310 /DNA_ID=CAMNT_0014111395 /DNA_START=128 /DNA_END=1060 /DNA_ORIENTATION=-
MAASTETTDPVPQVKFALITIAIAAIPSLAWWVSKQSKGTDWLYKAAWVGAFIVNLITVSIPGRFDGRAETTVDGKVTIPWKSLFEPSGWAFAIWGVIYASELLVTAYVGVIGQPSAVLTRAAPFWLMGNLFQSLWCFAFRKEFASILWLPMSLLALGAASLGLAHNELTVAIDALSDTFSTGAKWRLLLLRLPLALHTGWLSAASLLNLNAWMSVSRFPLDRQITTAFLSAYLGAALGAGLSVRSGDPFIAFTVAWALAALADRTLQKVKETPALVSADTQSALAMTEKMLSYALVAVGMGAGGARAIF